MNTIHGLIWVFCVPYYSHVIWIRNAILRLVEPWSSIIIFVHNQFFWLFNESDHIQEQYDCTLVDVDWMIGDWYATSYGSQGLGYLADSTKAMAQYIEPCEQLITEYGIEYIITDSITRWPVVAAQRLSISYTTRASLYPMIYQRSKLWIVKRKLGRNLLTQPRAVPSMIRWITSIIMTYKPVDRPQAESRFFDDSWVEHWVDLAKYFFDDQRLRAHPTMKIGHTSIAYDSTLTKQALIEAWCPWSEQQLRANEKVVYCALGSLIWINEEWERALTRLASQWRKVLCGSGRGWRSWLHKWVWYTPFAPQLACLDVARVFITHAWPKSCMEAVELWVPMIMYPHIEDQFLYAKRMVECGYGKQVGSWREAEEAVV